MERNERDLNLISELSKRANHFWFRHRNRIILDFVMRYCKRKEGIVSILELGAGSGNICRFLKAKGYKIDASDMYEAALRYFENEVDNVFKLDLVIDTVPDRLKYKYDIVILGDIIEHLEFPVPTLKKVKKFLKNNGRVLITVPALMVLWTPYDEYCGHIKRYNKRFLAEEIINSKYYCEDIGYFMFIPAIVLLFQRKIRSFFRRSPSDFRHEFDISLFVNNLMYWLMTIEYWVGKFLDYPFGSSLLGIAKKESLGIL